MTHELSVVFEFIKRGADEGVKLACVGGAARDTFLGKKPKDYDLVIQDYPHGSALVSLLEKIGGCTFNTMGNGVGEEYVYDADDRGLLAVYESSGFGVPLQILLFDNETMKRYEDPYEIVIEHDCSLNQAWFEEHNGELRARVTDEFPSPGGTNYINHGKADRHRAGYIKDKFPEFKHI